MAVTKRLRYEVLRRDNFACRYCGGRAPDVELTVDHVTPRALGGTDTADNLVAACQPCNAGKSSATADHATVAQVADDAFRWAAAIKRATAEMEKLDEHEEWLIGAFDEVWKGWTAGPDKEPIWRPDDWPATVRQLNKAGLTPKLLARCVDVAMTGPAKSFDIWRYFCGVAWRTLEDLQDRARKHLDVEP